MFRVLGVMVLMMLSLGMIMTGCTSDSELPEEARVGARAPAFELKNSDGELVSLHDLVGKPVVVNFWASWCGPCVFEMPFLEEIYEEWSGKGVEFLAVNVGEMPAMALDFVQKYGLSIPVLFDGDTEVARSYDIVGIPTTFFIDKNGVIQEKKIGAFGDKAEIESGLSKIIS